MPGCPEFACWTISIESVRMVLMQRLSRSSLEAPDDMRLAVELVSMLTLFIFGARCHLADDPNRITLRAAHELLREVATAESTEPRPWSMTDDDRVAVLVSRQ